MSASDFYPGYTDVTPAAGLLVGTSKPLQITILDEAGDPITGGASLLTLTIYDPSTNSLVKTAGQLTEVGSGVYEYEHEFDEAGYWVWDWLYDDGSESIRVGNFLRANPPLTSIGG